MKTTDDQNKSDGITAHFAAAIAGFALTAVGVGLCVTMVLLPLGLPLGLLGIGVLVWGLTPSWRR